MSEQLERILPVLSLIPGVNIPAGFLQSVYIAASQRKIAQLEAALRYQTTLLNQKIEAGKILLDKDYLTKDALHAHLVQMLRGVEIAESDEKIQVLARAFAGCVVSDKASDPQKSICMRIIGQISIAEMKVLAEITAIYSLANEDNKFVNEEELTSFPTIQLHSICRGLFQLGLLEDEKVVRWSEPNVRWWSPSALALSVIEICNKVEKA